jgi:hypothetical protein
MSHRLLSAYPYSFTFSVCFECLFTFTLIIIVSIETFHAGFACGPAGIIIFWRRFCSECVFLSLRYRVRKVVFLLRFGKREILSWWRHYSAVVRYVDPKFVNYSNIWRSLSFSDDCNTSQGMFTTVCSYYPYTKVVHQNHLNLRVALSRKQNSYNFYPPRPLQVVRWRFRTSLKES